MHSGQVAAADALNLVRRYGLGPWANVSAASVLALFAAIFFVVARRRYRSLPRMAATSTKGALPDCMVVIPARNEEKTIGDAVRSLPPDTVIVVDDHSEDRTAEVAREAGAGVLPAPALPRNGIGKANACAAGARVLTSRWILFTDADTRFEQDFLPAVVECAETNGFALLSVLLRPDNQSFAEHVIVPYARALFFCGARPKRMPNACFSGQCVLVRREPYVFLGSHSAVVTQIAEDVKLTRLAERHRLKIGVVEAAQFGRARMYQGFRGIFDGINRHALRFLMASTGAGVSVAAAALVMALWLPILVWLVAGGLGAGPQPTIAAVFALLPFLLLVSWYDNWWRALLAPVAIYAILPVLLRGFVSALAGSSMKWKGRTVRAVS